MPRLILLIILLGCFTWSKGQQPLYSHARWFKVEDGLPQSFISGLQQDKDGFLWVGTRDGLARYDGKKFRVFQHKRNDSLSLGSNVITDLFLDAQNLLWIFYINEQVDCFDPGKMQVCFPDSFQVVKELLGKLKTKKFIRDRSGRFWFNTPKNGVVCYDPLANKTAWFDSTDPGLKSNINPVLAEGPDGRIYVFTEPGVTCLKTKAGETGYFVPFDSNLGVSFDPGINHQLTVLPAGQLVMSESDRIFIFDPALKKIETYSLPPTADGRKNLVQQLQAARDGYLYIVATGGIYRFGDDRRFSFTWQSSNANGFANDCKSFLIDHSSVIWFGTNAAGIAKIDLHALPFNTAAYKINFTADILARLSPAIEKNIPTSLKTGKWAYTLRTCYDLQNRLWITYHDREETEKPLLVYVVEKNKINPVAVPPGNYPAIKGFSLSPSGEMYAVDLRGNFWKWPHISALPVFTGSVLKLNPASAVVDMETDGQNFWVSTDKEGLYKIEPGNTVKHFSVATVSNWPGNQLTDLCKDPLDPGKLWIGTLGNGLVQLNRDGSFRVLTTEHKLPNNTVYSIVPDQSKNLWVSTNNGIARFSPATNEFTGFDVKDGLAGNEFNRFHHFLFPDGRIAFGGPDGYSLFDPGRFRTDSFQTPVGLTGLLVNNKQVEFGAPGNLLTQPLNEMEELVLPYNKNFLQFEFAGLQFNKPEKILYRYKLEGYDKEWVQSDYNVAGYTRLPPGRYTLLLNASNTSGTWSAIVKKISIRIKPPFWATWWAYLVYIAITLLLLRTYWRYRMNRIRLQNEVALEHGRSVQLKELDELKDRFFSNITHELRTPLTLIMTPIEKLANQPGYPENERGILSNAYKNAEQLLKLINQLLDISKIESGQMRVNKKLGDLAELLERITRQFSMQAKQNNIQLHFINHQVGGLYLFDEEKWEKIIINLVNNAIKFTPVNGAVYVTVSEFAAEGGQLFVKLEVSDTGKGIPFEEIPRIFDRFYMVDSSTTRAKEGSGIGLALVKELVSIMNGKIDVRSEPGKGSIFTITVPVEKTTGAAPVVYTEMHEARQRGITEWSTERPVVLVVEDNEEMLAFLAESLADNWQVLKAANGLEGWELVVSELPDLIISDLMMPGMDGYELCSKVKDDPRTGHIGFVLLSARAAHENRLAGLKKGADDYLTKPFHFDELELKLHNLVEQQKRLRSYFQKELLPGTPLRKLPQISDIFIADLYKKLDDHIDDPAMSVDRLASLVNMSQRTLNRKLKALLNLTPVEFIRHYRLQKAALLISSGHGISETAYSVGFETASYFSQCFKEQFGKTPTEFASQKSA